jgi:hypothetical protein
VVNKPFSNDTVISPVPGSGQSIQYSMGTHFPKKASINERLKKITADPAFLESLNTMNFSHMTSEPYVPKSIRQQATNAGYGDVLLYLQSINNPPNRVGPLVNYPKRPPPGLAHPGMKPKATFVPKAMSPILPGYNVYSKSALSKKGGRKTRRGNRKYKKATRRRR